MKLVVYCTGGTELGFGHFFRAKTFVKAAPSNFKTLLVPVVNSDDKHFFNADSDTTRICSNEDEALAVILEYNAEMVIFDTVSCSDYFFMSVKKNVRRTISISPIFNQMRFVDYVFTRNNQAPEIDGVKVFKGLEYVVFNENCRFIPDEVYFHNLGKEYLTVGIAMGGGDAPNKTLQVLQSLCQMELPYTFWVFLGEGYRHSYQDLVTSIRKDSSHEIILAKTNRSMWNILSNCTIAILAGGLTTIESVYAGLPSLNLFSNEKHLKATGEQIFAQGAAENIGIFDADSLLALQTRLRELSANKSHLLLMRERSKGIIDKQGPVRIYNQLYLLNNQTKMTI